MLTIRVAVGHSTPMRRKTKMRQDDIRLNRTYRLKSEVWRGSVQVTGGVFESPDVTIVRQRFPKGRKTAWFYDASGNAFRAADFAQSVQTIEIETQASDCDGT
jgi:hypothetical protein